MAVSLHTTVLQTLMLPFSCWLSPGGVLARQEGAGRLSTPQGITGGVKGVELPLVKSCSPERILEVFHCVLDFRAKLNHSPKEMFLLPSGVVNPWTVQPQQNERQERGV